MPPLIIQASCNGCGLCIEHCGNFCLDMDTNSSQARVTRGQRCVDCFICELKCPEGAIEIKPRGLSSELRH